MSAEQEELNLVSEQRQISVHDYERNRLREKGTIYLSGDIDEFVARRVVEDILLITQEMHPITLLISSNGGHVESALSIIDAISMAFDAGVPVTGRIMGHGMSAAFYILQTCAVRQMGQSAWLMVHGFTSMNIGDIEESEATVEMLNGIRKQLATTIAERNTSDRGGYKDIEYWMKVLKRSTPYFMNAEQALKAGVVDEII